MPSLASGCCGVGTDVEGVREIITHGHNGLLVPHADAQALARTLAELLGDDARTQALAAVGQAHVHAAFDRQRMRQQYLALFADLAARKGVVRT